MTTTHKVIAGPAGHWYALTEFEGRDTLIGFPMSAGEDKTKPPTHPDVSGDWDGWVDITDPAPGVDDAAIIASLS